MIGIFGGSGLYSLAENLAEVTVDTPYGPTSSPVARGAIVGREVAFIARHGLSHEIPPHKINWRANLWAMNSLGVTRIIGQCAVGSLNATMGPGDLVVADQIVDRTSGRTQTFFDGPHAVHVSFADPYCDELRGLASASGTAADMHVHDRGTVVVIEGPRFSTRAESNWYRSAGFDIINMTQHPEAYLARELGICYVNLSLVTDYDSGLHDDPSVEAVTMDEVMSVFKENLPKMRATVFELVARVPEQRGCRCARALEGTPASSTD